jgi:hypothetical protein
LSKNESLLEKTGFLDIKLNGRKGINQQSKTDFWCLKGVNEQAWYGKADILRNRKKHKAL